MAFKRACNHCLVTPVCLDQPHVPNTSHAHNVITATSSTFLPLALTLFVSLHKGLVITTRVRSLIEGLVQAVQQSRDTQYTGLIKLHTTYQVVVPVDVHRAAYALQAYARNKN